MAVAQRNFNYGVYESQDGNSYCIRGDEDWQQASASGSTACAGEAPYGAVSPRRHPRYAIFGDANTGRKVRQIVYTQAAFDALTPGTSTLTVPIPGTATTATYTLAKLIPEAVPATLRLSHATDVA